MELKIFTDGGSVNNPGPAAIAFVVYYDNHLVYSFSKNIGMNTNNFAEYFALLNALEWLKNNNKKFWASKITCLSDSSLLVNQLNGLFKVKNATIRDFIMNIRSLEQEIKTPIVYKYIPREQNRQADSLVKKALQNF